MSGVLAVVILPESKRSYKLEQIPSQPSQSVPGVRDRMLVMQHTLFI